MRATIASGIGSLLAVMASHSGRCTTSRADALSHFQHPHPDRRPFRFRWSPHKSRGEQIPRSRIARSATTVRAVGRGTPSQARDSPARYTERLAEAGIELSVGSTGDSYDNALAETVIGLFKTEEIYRRGPWKGLEDVEFATLEWVAWYNRSRLLAPLGYVPPAEFEQAYHDRQTAPAEMAVLT